MEGYPEAEYVIDFIWLILIFVCVNMYCYTVLPVLSFYHVQVHIYHNNS